MKPAIQLGREKQCKNIQRNKKEKDSYQVSTKAGVGTLFSLFA